MAGAPFPMHLPAFLLCLLQALIYPLTVASKSTTTARHNAANKILKNMCEHSNTLVQQAMMVSGPRHQRAPARLPAGPFPGLTPALALSAQVSEELIRVAILWHEMWHEGLEEASRLYFGERNVKGMFEVLEPLHAMMERGPQTLKETPFNQVRAGASALRTPTPFLGFVVWGLFCGAAPRKWSPLARDQI